MEYQFRYIARFLLEATTPLSVGSGDKDLLTDSPVSTDRNGLPMIPGSSLCGVLRHSLLRSYASESSGEKLINSLFGYQKDDKGEGSRLVVSNALLAGKDNKVVEDLQDISKDQFFRNFLHLPIRQHCRINHHGTADADAHGKFDNKVVYKGSRFVFELELAGTKEEKEVWQKIIKTIQSPLFRIGSGTRKGYGELKTISLYKAEYDLTKTSDLNKYLAKSSSLTTIPCEEPLTNTGNSEEVPAGVTSYRIKELKPESFFLFSSGFGNNKADITPVIEKEVTWEDNSKPKLQSKKYMALVPGSSVKGALAHRTAFHFNHLEKKFADQVEEELENYTGENNEAVTTLFGCAKNKARGHRGRVIISDVFFQSDNSKILNHVAIDRFTQGAIDGALFSEEVLSGGTFELEIMVEHTDGNTNINLAFERALLDLANGMLPLGGGVMRGHGVFTASKVEKKQQGDDEWKIITSV